MGREAYRHPLLKRHPRAGDTAAGAASGRCGSNPASGRVNSNWAPPLVDGPTAISPPSARKAILQNASPSPVPSLAMPSPDAT